MARTSPHGLKYGDSAEWALFQRHYREMLAACVQSDELDVNRLAQVVIGFGKDLEAGLSEAGDLFDRIKRVLRDDSPPVR